MSRVGLKIIELPENVQVTVSGAQVTVTGPKGKLQRSFDPDFKIVIQDRTVRVERPTDSQKHRATHGLTRALLANMVTGVSQGFTRTLEVEGTGYRIDLQGSKLVLQLGYSHPIEFDPPEGISFDVPKGGRAVTVSGIDKELVGETAARIRRQRPPEPYQGKGVRYAGERIRRKAGKAGKVGKK
ncbi:MAG: 50S ribosomal protein L6 [Anaerolineae bacterium]|nr:50S ribosomal protein L6 [Anaerolineae bacterium]